MHQFELTTSVVVVRWPEEAGLRRLYLDAGVPRLLDVACGIEPPDQLDQLEDWVRRPAMPDEVAARCDRLGRLARVHAQRPVAAS